MESLITELVILFLLSIGVSLICARLKLPSTVGFLFTGILCGPSLLGIVSDKHAIDLIAEYGVALLLFTIGIELSGDALNRLKKPVFIGGTLQIGLSVTGIAIIVWLTGYTFNTGLFMGCLVALSSSAIVLRILQERGATSTPSGRLSLAILVFQDIMVAPMLLAVPLLAGTLELSPMGVLKTMGSMVLALGGILLFGHFLLPRLMSLVVRTRMHEVLLLTTLGICMGFAVLTESLGLSLSLGAFLAGLLLARSEYSMSVISGVLPYKDVFMSIFFISVGMLLDVNFLITHFWIIILNTAIFLLLKFIFTLPSVLMQGYPLRTAIITSLSLAQVGEFAFVLAAEGLDANLIDALYYQEFLAMSILTMMLTPLLINRATPLANWVQSKLHPHIHLQDEETPPTVAMQDHLIIIGFGVSGQHLASVAKESGIAYQILEMNPDTVSRFQRTEPISHGDATQAIVLEHLGVHTAKALAIVISDPAAVRAIITAARNLNPSLYIIARTRFFGEVGPLQQLGADDVVAEEFESSLEVFSHVLNKYLIPQKTIDAFTSRIRQEQYKQFCSLAQKDAPLNMLMQSMPLVGVHSVLVEDNAPLAGKTLAEGQLRRKWGVTVIGINRKGKVIAAPGADTCILPGDLVYIFGDRAKAHDALTPFTAPEKEQTPA